MNYKFSSLFILLFFHGGLLFSQGGFLGVEYEKLSSAKLQSLNITQTNGSYVTRVLGNSTAGNAGIQPMDYLFGIDDKRTSRTRDMGDILATYSDGDEVTLHFYRKGRKKSARTTFVPRSETYRREREESAFLGVSPHSRNNGDEPGVRVNVVRNSTAQVMGLRNGDIIHTLNGYPIITWVDISLAMSLFQPGETIAVELEREGQRKTLKSVLLNEEEREALSDCEDCGNKKAYLGFYSESVSRSKADKLNFENPYGAYVTKVIPGTAADDYGLAPFDYIYGVDEYRVGKEQSLTHVFSKYYAGDEAMLYLTRKGSNRKLPIVFGQRGGGEEGPQEKDPCEKAFLGVQQAYGNNELGVQINPVRNSTAEALGLQDGDIITAINGYPMIDWSDISTALGMVRAGDEVELTWLHNDTEYRKSLPIKSVCETRGSSRSSGYVIDHDEEEEKALSGGASLEGMNTRLTTLDNRQVEELNGKMDLDLEENTALEVDNFSLIADSDRNEHRIRFSLPTRGETQVRVFNMKGRIVYAYDLGVFVGDFNDNLNLANNGPGTYFLEIRQDGESSIYQIDLENK
jgi:S1-C subfamily serine protease